MVSFSDLLAQGSAHAWLFIPSAIFLGALHGLEPGHSKTMMAAFIIAIRGTVLQAALLGLAATVSHTAIVWAIALVGLHYGSQWNTETTEPYLQVISAVLIIGIALWMLWRTWQEQRTEKAHHHHHDDSRIIDTGHGRLSIDIVEDGVPPRWRIFNPDGAAPEPASVCLTTIRPDGMRQDFTFSTDGTGLESFEDIPEPHAFEVHLVLSHGNHHHTYEFAFHEHDEGEGDTYRDAHERAHVQDIQKRFTTRDVTTWQIVLFGLTGGLIPCPASITILLLCLQLKEFALGAVLVLCFSLGLAMTLVSVGAVAALSLRHVSSRWSWFADFARRAPYFSGALMICIGLYTGYIGWAQLSGHL